MKIKNLWTLLVIIGVLVLVVSLTSAFITAKGGFLTSDPNERINRIDFVWAAVGLIVAVLSFYRVRQLKK